MPRRQLLGPCQFLQRKIQFRPRPFLIRPGERQCRFRAFRQRFGLGAGPDVEQCRVARFDRGQNGFARDDRIAGFLRDPHGPAGQGGGYNVDVPYPGLGFVIDRHQQLPAGDRAEIHGDRLRHEGID